MYNHLSTNYNTKREKVYDYNTLSTKFQNKKKKLKEMKNNFNNLYDENENLKAKILELEKYKKSVLNKLDNFNHSEISREKELLDQIRSLEGEVKFLKIENNFTGENREINNSR